VTKTPFYPVHRIIHRSQGVITTLYKLNPKLSERGGIFGRENLKVSVIDHLPHFTTKKSTPNHNFLNLTEPTSSTSFTNLSNYNSHHKSNTLTTHTHTATKPKRKKKKERRRTKQNERERSRSPITTFLRSNCFGEPF
jgi:hypothetical protein